MDSPKERLQGKKVGLVRMDSGFFSGDIFDRLEGKRLPYIVACRFNDSIKIRLSSQAKWTEVADGLTLRTESRKSSTTSLPTSYLPKTSGLLKPATPSSLWPTISSVFSGMLSSTPSRVIPSRPSGIRYSVFLHISKRKEIKYFTSCENHESTASVPRTLEDN